jgi:ADP-heptose:LPS heptosyltransferase
MQLLPVFPDVERIAVLRGGGIGDVLYAVPALHALHAAYPEAALTVLSGRPGRLLEGRLPFPVRVCELPRAHGVHEAPDASDDVDGFLAAMRAERFDLALQLHGGGRNSNPFVLGLGARHTAGARTPDAPALERSMDYVYYQHEFVRGLEVAALAGAAPVTLEPELRPLPGDAEAATDAWPAAPGQQLVALHPGASDPRRRWCSGHFARVAAALAADGACVAVIGDRSERALAEEVRLAAASDLVVNLAGTLELPALIGLLARAALFVGNDSGPRHLAQALGAPTAAVFWVGNTITAAPLSRRRHRLRMSMRANCPVCGADQTQVGWTAPHCGHDASFVAEVRVEDVLEDARALLAGSGAGSIGRN